MLVRNNPCSNVDVNGRCSAPAGLKAGSVGICLEAFISVSRFGPSNIAHGDRRSIEGDGNNAGLTSRIQVQAVITATLDTISVAQDVKPGISTVTIAGEYAGGFSAGKVGQMKPDNTLSLKGEASANVGVVSTDAQKGTEGFGNSTIINVSGTATNGFQFPIADYFAPAGEIEFNVNFKISGSGKVDYDGVSKGYPTYAAYAYTIVDGKVQTQTIFVRPENKIEDLTKPMTPIPRQ